MTEIPLSPMLVQYLVGLCCLRWSPDAVEVKLGDMVYDKAAKKARDVDVTVRVETGDDGTYAFMAYEVKREQGPLDVAAVEQLATKLRDMKTVTHRAVVSASGFTAAARSKAKRHRLDLFELQRWTRRLEEQFPELAMKGTIQECFPLSKFLLCWLQHQFALVAREAKAPFTVNAADTLFGQRGKPHTKFNTFLQLQGELLLRSTEVLHTIEPAATVLKTFPIPAFAPEGQTPAGPAWPHTHTLDLSADAIYVATTSGLCKLDQVTISGHLQWQRSTEQPLYYVLQNTFSGEAFAGALISTEIRPGHMTALVFSAKSREIGIQFVRLADKHLNCIRELTLPQASRSEA